MDTQSAGYGLLNVEPTNEPSAYFVLDQKPFCFAGTNNYYLNFKSKRMVDDMLVRARDMGLKVIRLWAYLDRGSLDGSVPAVDGDGTKDGVYLQYWDAKAGRPAYNDGKDGLERLDYVLKRARELDLKLIMVLTNNWRDFGGMDQYLVWYGIDKHHLFYEDPRVKGAYKDWVRHLIQRKNRLDGVVYREDPAIFAWELANEPRCRNYKSFDADGWDNSTITRWVEEMSGYIKSLDPNHMVAVGDEGFLNAGGKLEVYKAQHGVDHEALSAVKTIDFATFHLYPDNWGTGLRFTDKWIRDHIEVARRVGKPTVLEEYGALVRRDENLKITWGWERRKTAYVNWNERMLKGGGNGTMVWMLAGVDDYTGIYKDYDGYMVYYPGETGDLLRPYSDRFLNEARACQLAAGAPTGPPSKFVSVQPPPGRQPQASLDAGLDFFALLD